jgi:DNA polymerase (family 10)
VDRISFLAAGADARKVWETLFSISAVAQRTDLRHPALIAGVSPHGLPFEIKLVEMENYGWELVEATGNTEHVTALRQRLDNSRRFETEAAVYEAAGLPYIAPELREGHGEIELAASGRLQNLVKPEDVQGIFHNHTTYSDGAATVEQMVTVAHTLGYSYIGISDHSQSAFYANGLKEDRIKAQHAEIDELQKRWSQIRIFKGIEADILVDGTMDYADEILARFDFVIASVHSRFNLSEEDQTLRICRALSNPYVTMLGHATGRLLLSRDGFRVDMRRVIDTAAANGKILEINASPHRLELDWRFCRYAKQRGAKFSINPDAHSTEGLATVPLGVNVARKGALSADDIVNTLPVSKMETLLQSLRP